MFKFLWHSADASLNLQHDGDCPEQTKQHNGFARAFYIVVHFVFHLRKMIEFFVWGNGKHDGNVLILNADNLVDLEY